MIRRKRAAEHPDTERVDAAERLISYLGRANPWRNTMEIQLPPKPESADAQASDLRQDAADRAAAESEEQGD